MLSYKYLIDVCGFTILLACIYVPPEGSVYAEDDVYLELEQLISDNRKDSEVCIVGDLDRTLD